MADNPANEPTDNRSDAPTEYLTDDRSDDSRDSSTDNLTDGLTEDTGNQEVSVHEVCERLEKILTRSGDKIPGLSQTEKRHIAQLSHPSVVKRSEERQELINAVYTGWEHKILGAVTEKAQNKGIHVPIEDISVQEFIKAHSLLSPNANSKLVYIDRVIHLVAEKLTFIGLSDSACLPDKTEDYLFEFDLMFSMLLYLSSINDNVHLLVKEHYNMVMPQHFMGIKRLVRARLVKDENNHSLRNLPDYTDRVKLEQYLFDNYVKSQTAKDFKLFRNLFVHETPSLEFKLRDDGNKMYTIDLAIPAKNGQIMFPFFDTLLGFYKHYLDSGAQVIGRMILGG